MHSPHRVLMPEQLLLDECRKGPAENFPFGRFRAPERAPDAGARVLNVVPASPGVALVTSEALLGVAPKHCWEWTLPLGPSR